MLGKILGSTSRREGGHVDTQTETYWTTPWAWSDDRGVYVGWNKEVWVYRELPLYPITWEDDSTKLGVGAQLATLLYELGETVRDRGNGIAALSTRRELHLLGVTWQGPVALPPGTPPALGEYLQAAFSDGYGSSISVAHKSLIIGVKLRSSTTEALLNAATGSGRSGTRSKKKVLGQLKDVIVSSLGEDVPDLAPFEADLGNVDTILIRNGARPLSADASNQLESWYNLGQGPDATILEAKDSLIMASGDRLEMAAVMKFENPVMHAPSATWLLDAMTSTQSPATVVSVRGELEAATVARTRARNSQRRIIAQVEEEAATGDLARVEDSITFQLAQQMENMFAAGEPIFSRCSIILARRVGDGAESYIDELRTRWGIRVKPLEHRQLAALDETLPCSSKRVNPFLQDVTIPLLAYAGLQAFGELGDRVGVHVGLTAPDYTPCYLNPLGAPAANLPPGMLLAGDPGSGKTWMAQTIAVQCVLAGLQTIFINPKGFESMEDFAALVGGSVVKLSSVDNKPGFFDPFRFTDPGTAAKIANDFIMDVLGSRGAGTGMTPEQEIKLGSGLQRAAQAGATYVGQALDFVEDPALVALIRQQAEADPTFRLAISNTPVERFRPGSGLTLIEFDRPLDFPEKGTAPSDYTRQQRIALAAVRLVTRTSMEMLAASQGGTIIVDEAWTFLSSSEGLATVQRLGRLGRSQNILPIFATQRVDDLLREGVDMEGYLSRVFVMKLNDEREARAALRLCGLAPTTERIAWLRQAGPRKAENGLPGRPAFAIHKDLNGRHAAVLIGPTPPAAAEAFSTNPEERAKRQAARLANPYPSASAAPSQAPTQ